MKPWKQRCTSKLISSQEAASKVKHGDRVYFGSICSEPKMMIKALAASGVTDVEMIQFLTGPTAAFQTEDRSKRFSLKSFFVGARTHSSRRQAEADYVPLFHSQIPDFFRKRRIPIDVAVVQVSEPDRFGRFSLGISVDISLAAVQSARIVIAQVNPRMPRTLGNTVIPEDRISFLVDGEEVLAEVPEWTIGERERSISRYCAELVDDGSVLQFGFSGIARGMLGYLKDRRNLGIHTEIFTDPLAELIEAGAVDNSTKKLYPGKSLATCCIGTQWLYDYVNDNPLVEFYPSDMVLNPSFIQSHDKMVAVNMAQQVDLQGQIRHGGLTPTVLPGSGGDHDFMRGASLSKDGRSVVCLLSTSEKTGRSNIVASFSRKAAVMMNRGDANYIITEHGIAYLGGKSVHERAMALIEIAHPDHSEILLKHAHQMGYLYRSQFYYKTATPELRARVRTDHIFKGGLKAQVRAIKPTDESMIKDLFYHLSDGSVYFRYFTPRKSMPYENAQQYVNVSDEDGLSLVVTVGPWENCCIIAESRYLLDKNGGFADASFMVDEDFQGRGLARFLLNHMMEIAKEHGVKGFTADVLLSNSAMLRVFDEAPYVLHRTLSKGTVSLKFRFDEAKDIQMIE